MFLVTDIGKLFLGTKKQSKNILNFIAKLLKPNSPQKVAQGNDATKKVFQEKVGETFIQKKTFLF